MLEVVTPLPIPLITPPVTTINFFGTGTGAGVEGEATEKRRDKEDERTLQAFKLFRGFKGTKNPSERQACMLK